MDDFEFNADESPEQMSEPSEGLTEPMPMPGPPGYVGFRPGPPGYMGPMPGLNGPYGGMPFPGPGFMGHFGPFPGPMPGPMHPQFRPHGGFMGRPPMPQMFNRFPSKIKVKIVTRTADAHFQQ